MSTLRKAVIAPVVSRYRQYPASSAMPVMLFPLVDRDGLTKPLLQIVAEEAIDSGIESIAVVASAEEANACRDYFRRWPEETARSLRGQDWAILQSEKLAALGERLTFVQPSPHESNDHDAGYDLLAARSFVGVDSFLLLPATTVFLSGTKDRCAAQLLGHGLGDDADCVMLMKPVMERDLPYSTIVQATVLDRGRRQFSISAVIDRPTLDESVSFASSELPAGHFFAHAGSAILPPQIFDCLEAVPSANDNGQSALARAIHLLCEQPKRVFGIPLIGSVFDAALPYGLLESQLGLALAGIHRAEICEMIARTLAEQAKS